MIPALIRFVRERFHPLGSVPLAAAAVLGPLLRRQAGSPAVARGLVTAWVALLVLRMIDDLADLEADRAFHPERGLCSGAIDAGALRRAALALAAGLLALLPRDAGSLPLLGGAALYALFYGVRGRLPRWLAPIPANAVFGLLPLTAAASPPRIPDLLLAAFVYLAALGHEWGHDVHARHERPPGAPSLANAYGARASAAVSALLFAAASAAGAAFWAGAGRPAIFGVALLGTAAGLASVLARLLLEPSARRARPLYVGGMAFWALPLFGLVAG
jgi:4-hydroxybenzoate polyprenyltransferase